MKRLNQIPIYFFMALVLILTSCLKGDQMNTPPGGSTAIMAMAYNPAALSVGGFALNSGLRYFGNAALTYPHADVADTAVIGVVLQGVAGLGKDVNVTLVADQAALLDYYATDSISYVAMPDSVFSLVSTTGVIKAGTSTAEFKVVFHPTKVDLKKSFMLALTSTNDANIPFSANYDHIYFHFIGNAIQGAYTYDYYRYNCAGGVACTGAETTTVATNSVSFAPLNAHQVITPGTYFNSPVYVISFTDDGVTVSNYKVAFYNLDASLTAAGVTVASGPTITENEGPVTVHGHAYTGSAAHPVFVVHFVGFNGTNFRDIYDVYTKQ